MDEHALMLKIEAGGQRGASHVSMVCEALHPKSSANATSTSTSPTARLGLRRALPSWHWMGCRLVDGDRRPALRLMQAFVHDVSPYDSMHGLTTLQVTYGWNRRMGMVRPTWYVEWNH